MDITIIVAIACLIVGGAVGYMIFRYVINGKYKEMVSAAEKEAERIIEAAKEEAESKKKIEKVIEFC